MNITINPRLLRGNVRAIGSKSFAHRQLILAAFADRPTQIRCPETNRDIEVTAACLRALGATIQRAKSGYTVFPAQAIPEHAELPCGESGSTLRFILPVVGALGVRGEFITEGRLAKRPLSPLWEEMERMGCHLEWIGENRLLCQGKLKPGNYNIDGSVSSQFITGLLLGLSLLPQKSTLQITGQLQSKPYVDITKEVMGSFGADTEIPGGIVLHSPAHLEVEGDWSNAAFFLTAAALGSAVTVTGLNQSSVQGDRQILECLKLLDYGAARISVADIPDLMPVLSIAAAAKHGAVFADIQRLRLKESDRVESVCAMLTALGIRTEATESTLRILPDRFTGGTVDAANDHRIAMSAAIAATVATGPVTIKGAECVTKSYPDFWEDYRNLGGQYEFDLR